VQTYGRIELVVVDDHSETPASEVLNDGVAERFEHFRCVRHEENRGANAARNTGIEAASGDFVAFLDDDDRWASDKLARQVDVFQRSDDDVGLVYTGAKQVRDDREEVHVPTRVDGDMTKALLCRNVVGTQSSVMVRADLAAETPFDERFPAWADLEWYVSLSRKCEFRRLPGPLVEYEFSSPGRLSDDFEKAERGYHMFVEKYRPVAAEYGLLFERKMLGWAAFRVAAGAFHEQKYSVARRYLELAVRRYPFEPLFLKYLAASLGGRSTHKVARLARRLTSDNA
jgi:glycosyltransferase involved in cell wall biosynthesis